MNRKIKIKTKQINIIPSITIWSKRNKTRQLFQSLFVSTGNIVFHERLTLALSCTYRLAPLLNIQPTAMASSDSLGEKAWVNISTLFMEQGTSDYVGEPVSQAEHSLQAAKCALDATKSEEGSLSREEVVLAALLHDCGHMLGLRDRETTEWMGECGAMNHEGIGGEFVSSIGLTPRVAKLVAEHVNAKRYLTGTNPAYYDKLSPASKTTLGYQGGPFTRDECTAFEANPDHKVILKMRTWDEAAKVSGLSVPTLESYRGMVLRNVASNA